MLAVAVRSLLLLSYMSRGVIVGSDGTRGVLTSCATLTHIYPDQDASGQTPRQEEYPHWKLSLRTRQVNTIEQRKYFVENARNAQRIWL